VDHILLLVFKKMLDNLGQDSRIVKTNVKEHDLNCNREDKHTSGTGRFIEVLMGT